MKVERGVDNINELIPFMNKVFHKRFPSLLPKLYTTNRYTDNHYYVKENGKIVGAIASLPVNLKVYDKTLIAHGVGMVSCHPKYRGQGIMSSMLKRIINDAKAEGVDFMYLSGNRQRYEHYGFVPVGVKHTFVLKSWNMGYMTDRLNYSFVRVTENSPYIKDMAKIYDAQDVRYDRYDFLKVVKSWNIKKVYAILNDAGIVVGHLATIWGKIVDFATSEPQNSAYIVKAFTKSHSKFTGVIDLYPHQYEEIQSLTKYAQSSRTEEPASFKILNYRNVVSALLQMEAMHHKLSDFDININIEGVENFNIKCHDNAVVISDFSATAKTFTFSDSEATLKLFSHVDSMYSGLPFTLPLFVTLCDNV